MKRFSLIAIIVLIANVSMLKAQTTKGKFLLGVSSAVSASEESNSFGRMGYSTSKTKGDDPNSIGIKSLKILSANASPRFGYFVIDNFALGLNVCLYAEHTKVDNDYTFISSLIGVGPFVRYYLACERIKPFFEIGGYYGQYGSKYLDSNFPNSRGTRINFDCGAGLAFPIGDKVNFDIQLNYDYNYQKRNLNNPTNIRTNTSNVGLKLGFVVLLGS